MRGGRMVAETPLMGGWMIGRWLYLAALETLRRVPPANDR